MRKTKPPTALQHMIDRLEVELNGNSHAKWLAEKLRETEKSNAKGRWMDGYCCGLTDAAKAILGDFA